MLILKDAASHSRHLEQEPKRLENACEPVTELLTRRAFPATQELKNLSPSF
jgi:hypothetical protein